MRILFHVETGDFLLTAASIPGLGPTQPPFQWELVVSTEVKQLVLNDYHLAASSSEVKNVWRAACCMNLTSLACKLIRREDVTACH